MDDKKKPRTAGTGTASDTAFTEHHFTAIVEHLQRHSELLMIIAGRLSKLVTLAEKGGRHD